MTVCELMYSKMCTGRESLHRWLLLWGRWSSVSSDGFGRTPRGQSYRHFAVDGASTT